MSKFGKDCSPFETETGTRDHVVPEVLANGAKRVLLEHLPKFAKLPLGFLSINVGHKLDALANGHISPVSTVCIVQIIRVKQSVEDVRFVRCHVMSDVDVLCSGVVAGRIRPVRCSDSIVADRVFLAMCGGHCSW